MMDHVEATRIQAVERYLLGDLSSSERDDFEEHFFSCPACADDVVTGAAFIDNARAELHDQAEQALHATPRIANLVKMSWGRSRFITTVAVAGFAVLAVFTGYQNTVEIPHLRQVANEMDTLVVTPSVALAATRGAGSETVSRGEKQYSIFVPNEWNTSYPRYVCEVRKAPEGSVVLSGDPFSASGSFTVSIPIGKLEPGRYALRVYGLTSGKTLVARQVLTVKEK